MRPLHEQVGRLLNFARFAGCNPFWIAVRRGSAKIANRGDKFAHRLRMLDFASLTRLRNRLWGLVSRPTSPAQPAQRGETNTTRSSTVKRKCPDRRPARVPSSPVPVGGSTILWVNYLLKQSVPTHRPDSVPFVSRPCNWGLGHQFRGSSPY
jgi:hypothetical protein